MMIGTWVLYLPQVKQKLNLDDSQLGFALFCLAFGLLCIMPIVPFLSKTIGLGRCTIIGICFFSLAFVFPLYVNTYLLLCISLFVVGVFSGFTDITMNAIVSQFEQEDQVTFMSSAHGFFSLGGALSGLLGAVLMSWFKFPFYHMMMMSGVVLVSNILLANHYIKLKEQAVSKDSTGLKFHDIKPLLSLAFIAVVVMGNEGAIEHWSSIYLIDIVKVSSKELAGYGFTLFSMMMTAGRFFGDGISIKLGSLKTIVFGCILAIIGFSILLLGYYASSVAGFGIIGLGLSVIVPELMRLAGQTKNISATKSISFVSGAGFLGFLLGPIVLGYLSDIYNLKISFSFLLGLTLLAVLLTQFKLMHKKNK